MAKAFGLGAPTDIPYLPEVAGTVPDPKWKLDTFGDYWATGDAINLAIGQGFLEATPLQMAIAYAAIANGGDLLQPYIVELALGPGGEAERIGERVVRAQLPLSRATVRELQSALRDQTSDWSGAGSVPRLRRLRLADRRQDGHRPEPARPLEEAALLVRRLRPVRRGGDHRLGGDGRERRRGRHLRRPGHPPDLRGLPGGRPGRRVHIGLIRGRSVALATGAAR